jgi:hypothetical protein
MVENFRGTASASLHRRPRVTAALLLAALVALAVSVVFCLPGGSSAPLSRHAVRTQIRTVDALPAKTAAVAAPVAALVAVTAAPRPSTSTTPTASTPATTTTTPTTTTPTSVDTTTVATPLEPSIAALVAEAEAAGIEPGSNWSWSMGDTATHCGVIVGAGTGCTFGAAGLEQTVFAGSPTLTLVAHELANAETQNDAVPGLLDEVAAAAGTTSWSPTDAVASCLVAHFMGIQDEAAGTWQCSSALATFVAANIHDTLSTVVAVAPR